MNDLINIGLAGRFILTFTNTSTGEVRSHTFNNMVLDSGLNRYGSVTTTSGHIGGCILSSATDEPVATQTTVSSAYAGSTTLVSTSVAGSNTTTLPYWTKRQWTYSFAAGVGTGDISQIAMGWGVAANGTATGIFSLARVKDSNGNPITLTKLADEVLDVRYELQMISPSTDVTGTVVLEGQTYNFTMRPAQAGNWDAYYPVRYTTGTGLFYNGNIGSPLNLPSGSSAAGATNTLSSSVAGNFYCDGTISASLTQANLSGGVRSILLQFEGHKWQIQFSNVVDDTAVTKNSTKIFSINFRISFGRANVIT